MSSAFAAQHQHLRTGFAARALRGGKAPNRITIRPSDPDRINSVTLGQLDFPSRDAMIDFLRSRPADSGSAYELKGQDLTGADFSGVKHLFLVFDGCRLDKTDFSGTELWGCTFRNCHLGQTDFSNSAWKTGRIENCGAKSADFTDAHLHDVRFLGSDVGTEQLRKAKDGIYFVDGKLSYDLLGKPRPPGMNANNHGRHTPFF